MARRDWSPILERAAEIVRSYDTFVTLRQLFYRLVAAEVLRNVQADYQQLASKSAAARRNGGFPALTDSTRSLSRLLSWESVGDALDERVQEFRLDRAAGQEHDLYVFVEKAALEPQIWSWFGGLGIGVAALRGYHSVPLERQIRRSVERRRSDGEESRAVALYVGDFDPTGTDIERNFTRYLGGHFAEFRRVALTWDQVTAYDLPPQLGKAADPRAATFAEEHGELVQVEADALPPDTLRDLLTDAVDEFFDRDTYDAVIEREGKMRDRLADLVAELDTDDEEEE
jgi:hypothetical protein